MRDETLLLRKSAPRAAETCPTGTWLTL